MPSLHKNQRIVKQQIACEASNPYSIDPDSIGYRIDSSGWNYVVSTTHELFAEVPRAYKFAVSLPAWRLRDIFSITGLTIDEQLHLIIYHAINRHIDTHWMTADEFRYHELLADDAEVDRRFYEIMGGGE